MFHLKDTDQRDFSYHYHDFHKILILQEGDVTYCVEGRTYELLPGDIVLVNAGEVHRPILKSGKMYDRIIIYVSPDFISGFDTDDGDLTRCFKQAASDQSHVLRFTQTASDRLGQAISTLDQSMSDDDYGADLNRKLIFLEFMLQLNRAAINSRVEYIQSSTSDDKIIAVLDYIDNHITDDVSIDDISGRFFLSRYYLMHSFKEQTGYTIGGYLNSKRLLKAQSLIRQGMPVTEVCYAAGFKNYSTFSRAYKKSFGESPREFRQSLVYRSI
jgi:AraC-like DNA-binding protein